MLCFWYVWLKSLRVCCLRIHKDEAARFPYIYMTSNGTIYSEQVMKLVCTCQMDIHKFPFDMQRCNISAGSALHSGEGGSVCLCVWLSLTIYVNDTVTFSIFSHLSWRNSVPSFLQLSSGHTVFPRVDADSGRLGVPPADCVQQQFYLQQQTVGTTYLHCTKST